jgi:phospholipid/cholesterol/gamma-HCH transport system permease protein
MVRDLCIELDGRGVLTGIDCAFPRGEISIILGASGAGKSTLLRAIGGLLPPDRGEIVVAGESISGGGRGALERARARIGMMFQGGALLDSMTVFDNLALPLREHSRLDEGKIAERVHSRLEAVGLSGVDGLLPGQLSGGMTKRTALARAMIGEPEILLCDEPFSGLDPVAVRRIEALLERVNREWGITMVVTSHHIPTTLRMASHVVFLLDQRPAAGSRVHRGGGPGGLRRGTETEGSRPGGSSGSGMIAPIERVGRRALEALGDLGRIALFGASVLLASLSRPFRIRRFLDELYDVGVRSLSIVCLSGVAVGLLLALQGHDLLVRFGAEQLLGAAIGLTLIRELGPLLTALLVTGRAGSAIAAEIGTMVATEQLDGLRMMSVDPIDLVVSPKALAMVVALPLLSALFIVVALFAGYALGTAVFGVDGGQYVSSLESAVTFREDVLGSLLKAVLFGALVGVVATYRGYTSEPTSAGVSNATTQTVVIASVATLILDYLVTALWEF